MARARDSIYLSIWLAFGMFVFLLVVFDLLRRRLWWVYEPRLRHAKYKQRTPPPPSRAFLGWIPAVMRYWSDETFLRHAGVDGLIMIYFLRFATDQCLFASFVGLVVLVPTYHTGRGLFSAEAADQTYSFATTTVPLAGAVLTVPSSCAAWSGRVFLLAHLGEIVGEFRA